MENQISFSLYETTFLRHYMARGLWTPDHHMTPVCASSTNCSHKVGNTTEYQYPFNTPSLELKGSYMIPAWQCLSVNKGNSIKTNSAKLSWCGRTPLG